MGVLMTPIGRLRSSPRRALVLGYGNPGRRDDGLGPRLAEAVDRMDLPRVDVESAYQLQAEDAAAVADHDVVVFVDADVSCPDPFELRPVVPAGDPRFSTHSLAPIMFITDTRPVKVNGFVMPYAEDDPVPERSVRQGDAASMIALRMDNGAVVKLLQVHLRGESIWVRIHGSRGQMENLRHGDRNMVRLRREQYHEERIEPAEQIYLPDFPEHHAEALKAGHGGGDFFMNFHFAEAIRKNEQPFLDVYRAVAMSTVGILAYRSALQDSNTLKVPDFRRESEREKYSGDDWSPDPDKRREDQPWPSILGDIEPTGKGLAYAHKVWKSIGYDGD